jgi:hypothetical protein
METNLPMPSQDDVKRFKQWHDRTQGGDISMKEAQSTFTGLLHFYYLLELHTLPRAQKRLEKLRSDKK